MAFGLPTDQRSQAMLLIIIACLAGGYFFWSKVQSPKAAAISQTQKDIDSLSAVISKAKADLASGSVEGVISTTIPRNSLRRRARSSDSASEKEYVASAFSSFSR